MFPNSLKLLWGALQKSRFDNAACNIRGASRQPRFRPPYWYVPKERVWTDDYLTKENKQFLEEVIKDKLEAQTALEKKALTSPILNDVKKNVTWTPQTKRVGLIARKIGNYPLWCKDGKKVSTTLLQVVDNHVIKYIPPEEYKPMIKSNVKWVEKQKYGCILVGAENIDPSVVTKDYCGIFDSVGMLPKRHLCRFVVSPESALPNGTPLYATHFRVGDCIDIRSKTMDRGFQGVMKRWGFKGMPASHGVTKTHRRPGNIGSGGEKARVWPGTKMPGHMGNRWRTLRGVKILRIDTKYNVIWTLGVAIPGETGAMCYLFDTVLPLKRNKTAPPFPTQPFMNDVPKEYFEDTIHPFDEPTISYYEEI
ncbi:39S ribosomal protein L3, mitochondrial [Bombyx mandarina]|uniref:Large ribosomal subunit protein uL3m n=2 Tax=Bombyx TaxID=7090 RepID=A0A8R2DME6_BOMMO|nr:39S ribosomal protein L3, mitochondrial [Bombyx mori]XP_028034194.1 39S ribosomal protein L3, mitochondrial [Bombyx mandarina]